MYQITTTKSKDSRNDILLDNMPVLRLPPVMFVGIGDKKKRYAAYLEKHFDLGEGLAEMICRLHAHGLRNKGLCILSHPKNKEHHAEVLKEFLIKYEEKLDLLIPYFFPDDREIQKLVRDNRNPDQAGEEQPVEEMGRRQPTEDDMAQIHALIKADQEKEAAAQSTAAVSETAEAK